MTRDLAGDVRELAGTAIRKAGAGSEGFGVSVTWQPLQTEFGNAVCWFFLLTLPSAIIGQPPLAVTAGPLLVQSLPQEPEITALVRQSLPQLREARRAQVQSLGDAARALGRLN